MPAEPIWLSKALVATLHQRQLAEHGGLAGVRDEGMLESALAKPRNRWAYASEDSDVESLAAAYAFGLARNHPFLDGNKRISAVVCETFLELNGRLLTAENASLYVIFLRLAEGDLSEEQLADWLRANTAATGA